MGGARGMTKMDDKEMVRGEVLAAIAVQGFGGAQRPQGGKGAHSQLQTTTNGSQRRWRLLCVVGEDDVGSGQRCNKGEEH
jgi:hypothetical protein